MWIRTCETGFTAADKQAIQRYRRGIAANFLVYMALDRVLKHYPDGLRAEVLAAVMGAAFFAMLLLAALLVVRSGDEFRRVLLLRSLLWATVVTMGLTCVCGFIEAFSHGQVRVPVLLVPAFLLTATAAAKLLIFRRHRVSDE